MAPSTLGDKDKQPEPQPEIFDPLGKKKRSPLILITALLLVGVGISATLYLWANRGANLRLSGRIEGYETDVGTKAAGRVISVAVREGEQVSEGQLLVRLDDAETNAQLQGAIARLNAAQQEELQARLEIDLIESQIREAELSVTQSQGDSSGRILQAESSLAASEAQLSQAQAQQQQAESALTLAQKDLDRASQLLSQGVISQQQYDQAVNVLETAQANLESRQASVLAFQRLVTASQGQLTQTRTTGLNPNIGNLQVQGLRTQLAQARLKIAAAGAAVASARAAQQEIRARVENQNIVSPTDGVVISRNVEPGAVVTTGKTLLTLINPQQLYLRGFVPEGEIVRVRLGQDVRIFLDSRPDQPLLGRVTAIDPQASFTPENIYFKEDRVRQVFGIRVSLDNLEGYAKPGMPAEAEIVPDPGS
jgi:HlyD family secretion protein